MGNKNRIILCSLFIAFLNAFDGFITHYGLITEKIEEFNPVMKSLWEMSPALFLSVKFCLSLLLLIVSYTIYQKSKKAFQQIFFLLLSGLFVMYSGVFFLHIFWLLYL